MPLSFKVVVKLILPFRFVDLISDVLKHSHCALHLSLYLADLHVLSQVTLRQLYIQI